MLADMSVEWRKLCDAAITMARANLFGDKRNALAFPVRVSNNSGGGQH